MNWAQCMNWKKKQSRYIQKEIIDGIDSYCQAPFCKKKNIKNNLKDGKSCEQIDRSRIKSPSKKMLDSMLYNNNNN